MILVPLDHLAHTDSHRALMKAVCGPNMLAKCDQFHLWTGLFNKAFYPKNLPRLSPPFSTILLLSALLLFLPEEHRSPRILFPLTQQEADWVQKMFCALRCPCAMCQIWTDKTELRALQEKPSSPVPFSTKSQQQTIGWHGDQWCKHFWIQYGRPTLPLESLALNWQIFHRVHHILPVYEFSHSRNTM